MQTNSALSNKTPVYSYNFSDIEEDNDSPERPIKRQKLVRIDNVSQEIPLVLDLPEAYVLLVEKSQGSHWHQLIKTIQKLRSLRKPAFLTDRPILLEWIIEVLHEFRFKTSVLFTAMMLLDRFVAKVQQRVKKDVYQGLLCACFSIACKMEMVEEVCPSMAVLASYTDNFYTVQQLIDMETLVLNVLEWDMAHVPSPAEFLQYFTNQPNEQYFNNYVYPFADKLVQLSLNDLFLFEQFDTSIIAASAIHAARCLLQLAPNWPLELYQLTGKSNAQLSHCSTLLQQIHTAFCKLNPQIQ